MPAMAEPDTRPFLAFACAHLADERLFAAQIAALREDHECAAFAFRDHDSLGAMAEDLLGRVPALVSGYDRARRYLDSRVILREPGAHASMRWARLCG